MRFLFVLYMHADTHGKGHDTVFPLAFLSLTHARARTNTRTQTHSKKFD